MAQRESKGHRLVIPDNMASSAHRVTHVQGFIDIDSTIGIWCLGANGQVLSQFNPSGFSEPKGTIHKLEKHEEIVGVCVT